MISSGCICIELLVKSKYQTYLFFVNSSNNFSLQKTKTKFLSIMKSLTKATYDKTIKEQRNKLLVIFFKKKNDAFTMAAQGVFDELVKSSKYPRTLFYEVQMEKEKELTAELKTHDFASAVFIVNGETKLQLPLMMPNMIETYIKKYQPEEFHGQSHTIKPISNATDYLNSISVQKPKVIEEPAPKVQLPKKPQVLRAKSEKIEPLNMAKEPIIPKNEDDEKAEEEKKEKELVKRLVSFGMKEDDAQGIVKITKDERECFDIYHRREEIREEISEIGQEALDAFNYLLQEFSQDSAYTLVTLKIKRVDQAKVAVEARRQTRENKRKAMIDQERNEKEAKEEQLRIEKEVLQKQKEKSEIAKRINIQRTNSNHLEQDIIAHAAKETPKSNKKCKISLYQDNQKPLDFIMQTSDTMETLIGKFKEKTGMSDDSKLTFQDSTSGKVLVYENSSTLETLGVIGVARFIVKKEVKEEPPKEEAEEVKEKDKPKKTNGWGIKTSKYSWGKKENK